MICRKLSWTDVQVKRLWFNGRKTRLHASLIGCSFVNATCWFDGEVREINDTMKTTIVNWLQHRFTLIVDRLSKYEEDKGRS